MEEHTVTSFADLWAILAPHRFDRRWIFRGQGSVSWQLIPKAGRGSFASVRDKLYFRKWKSRAVSFLTSKLEDDWDWLAVAQHHGLPTRLLDWSYNPLAACFFAVEEQIDDDAALYALNYQHLLAYSLADPFDPRWIGVRVHRPKGVVSRLVRQRGLFTVHQEPSLSLEEYLHSPETTGFRLDRIIIPKQHRQSIRADLWFLGVDRASLMDDLDSLSQQMVWELEQQGPGFREPYIPLDSGIEPPEPFAEQIPLFEGGIGTSLLGEIDSELPSAGAEHPFPIGQPEVDPLQMELL